MFASKPFLKSACAFVVPVWQQLLHVYILGSQASPTLELKIAKPVSMGMCDMFSQMPVGRYEWQVGLVEVLSISACYTP
jgi:hypothetical protein